MLKIFLAKHIGFCSGVKRAVNLADAAVKSNKIYFQPEQKVSSFKAGKSRCLQGSSGVYSLGQLIHNPQEVKRLEKAGLKVLKSLGNLQSGTLIVRSHGLPERIIRTAKRRGLKIIDATCPLVKNVQKIARELKRKNYQIIIIGDREHPEVKAIQERAGRKSLVISGKEKGLRSLSKAKTGVIAQTTESEKNFQKTVSQLKSIFKEIKCYNTICHESARRQKELLELIKKVDTVLIIGGFNSANTRRLAEMSRQEKMRTYHLENSLGLRKIKLRGVKRIGIITGASTPNWVVEEVVKELKGN